MGNFCLLLRGMPASGKSTLTEKIMLPFKLVDPDLVNTDSTNFSTFVPRQTKNPSHRVKLYAYMYNLAEDYLTNGHNVIWSQPWSRYAELDLTLRNFGYYLTNLGGKVWKAKPDAILQRLPFKFLVAEMTIKHEIALNRMKKRSEGRVEDLNRFNRTYKLFHTYDLPAPFLELDGNKPVEVNVYKLTDFVDNQTTK